jgi:hypothetical protein
MLGNGSIIPPGFIVNEKKLFMRFTFALLVFVLLLTSCHKNNHTMQQACNIEQAYTDNAKKVTITKGVWGTVSSIEGNCMPPACNNCCRHCPVQRTVKIYNYTTVNDAVKSDSLSVFYDSFNTQLITQVNTDENGFFQADIPPGKDSIVIVENGKLYTNSYDGQGGISPFNFSTGTTNVNLTMTHKAIF